MSNEKSVVTKQSELQLQGECFQWAWNTFPKTRRLLFHVPNGGKRSKVEASWLKSSGVISGIPDLLFLWKSILYAFEAKAEKGVVSDAQKAVHTAWAEHGVTVILFRTAQEFRSKFLAILDKSDEENTIPVPWHRPGSNKNDKPF